MHYGKEVIIDIHDTTNGPFNREDIERFCQNLCQEINMEPEDLFFWDYEGQPEEYATAPAHLKGTSAVQFIRTSNITIHTLDELKRVYLNIFSCKDFDSSMAVVFSQNWTGGIAVNVTEVLRK